MRLEKRLQARRHTMIEAEIVFREGRSRVACIIRNLSAYGAKLEVASVAGIPQSFDLLAPGRPARSCRVVWRTLRELGVDFRN